MKMAIGLMSAISLLLFSMTFGQMPMTAVVVETEQDAGRGNLKHIERWLLFPGGKLRYQRTFNPETRQTVSERYDDYLHGLAFAGEGSGGKWGYHWSGGWDWWRWLTVTVERDGKKQDVTEEVFQTAMVVQEQGKRLVFDEIWQLEDGFLVIRYLFEASQPDWLWLEVALVGAKRSRLDRVQITAYPTTSTGPRYRKRWMTTLTQDATTETGRGLKVASEWCIVMYSRYAQEEQGCVVVFDPNEIAAGMEAGGGYGIALFFNPSPNVSRVHFALNYFNRKHWREAVRPFLEKAPQILQQLRAMRWDAQLEDDGDALIEWQPLAFSEKAIWVQKVRSVFSLASEESKDAREAFTTLQNLWQKSSGMERRLFEVEYSLQWRKFVTAFQKASKDAVNTFVHKR
ncbi:MAG: hypothetical protein NZ937_00665 [Armatimonadetes bacterium]|nr:hypothetical protein [Armatimonadota bacterium]